VSTQREERPVRDEEPGRVEGGEGRRGGEWKVLVEGV